MIHSTTFLNKAMLGLSLVLIAMTFAGCSMLYTLDKDKSIVNIQEVIQADSSFYLQQMLQSSNNNTKINWQLIAICTMLKKGKTQQAEDLFNQLPRILNNTQNQE